MAHVVVDSVPVVVVADEDTIGVAADIVGARAQVGVAADIAGAHMQGGVLAAGLVVVAHVRVGVFAAGVAVRGWKRPLVDRSPEHHGRTSRDEC